MPARFPKVKFSCTICAACCRDVPGHRRNILMLEREAAEIGKITGKPAKEFCTLAKSAGPYKFRMRKRKGRCVFLGEDRMCAIYSHRPLICRFFPFELKADGSWDYSRACEGVGLGRRVPARFFRGLEKEARERFDREQI
jgi:Fe-S-cluster containining protein